MAWRVGAHVLGGAVQGGILFPRLSKPERERRIGEWAREMLKRLRVDLKIVGAPAPAGPMLLVSNHISWVDILALHAVCPCRFVAKADVARWPLLGTIVTGGGTLYVKRESRRDAMRVVHRMAEALKDGDILAVFPEGTTSDGSSVLPFHTGLIQAAIAADAPVQPVALRIVEGRSGRPSRAVSYMGDESLVGSVWRTLCARELCAVVTFGPPQRAAGRDRRAWARDLHREITAMRQPPDPPLQTQSRPRRDAY
ncbi:MAG: lysophospholipid acyltransferase family protein [Candidatus Rokuibacteriota bacterium]